MGVALLLHRDVPGGIGDAPLEAGEPISVRALAGNPFHARGHHPRIAYGQSDREIPWRCGNERLCEIENCNAARLARIIALCLG